MSVMPTYHVHCDGDECGGSFTNGERKAGDVRRAAAASGWTRRFVGNPRGQGPGWTLDFCPRCTPTFNAEVQP